MSITTHYSMAKNTRRSQKKRSQRRVLDAYHHAEKGGATLDELGDENAVHGGILDALRFLKNPDAHSDPSDEELDSDEALASDDDFDVLNSKFSQTIRDRGGAADLDDEGSASYDELELVTLSQAWDMDDRDNEIVLDDSGSEAESASDSASGSSSDSSSESEASLSEDEEAMLRGTGEGDISNTVLRLTAKLKTPEHKRLVAAGTENVFAVPTNGEKLTLAEMMGDATADAVLVSAEAAQPLAVPLPKRIQQRHDRRAAYEITKLDVQRWQDSVRKLQEADHVLFPLAPAEESASEEDAEAQVDGMRMVNESAERTALADKVHALLQAGLLEDELKEATFQQIAATKLSKEELFQRTQELRRMRELMFRDEQRARRIKKIKSKQFRKIRKRERLRDAALVDGEVLSDDEHADPEDHDRKRAEERMSLRHKTQGKWAQQMVRLGLTKDAGARADYEEMLRTGEQLRARQLGAELDRSDNVLDLEREMDHADDSADDAERQRLGKGVLAMDFMRKAEEKQRRQNQRDLAELRHADPAASYGDAVNQIKNQGRRVYTPAAGERRREAEEEDEEVLEDLRDEDSRSLPNQMSRGPTREAKAEAEAPAEVEAPETTKPSGLALPEFAGFELSDEENPWMAGDETNTNKRKRVEHIAADLSRMDKAAHKIAKSAKRARPGKAEKTPLVDLDNVLRPVGSDDDDDTTPMFQQHALIEEAFAGDDVTAEFAAEKQQMVQAEDDKEEDMTLPGWGGWAGAGAEHKPPKKKFVRKIDGVVQANKRRDRNLQNVIINETVNKHNLKYQLGSVPYGYETQEQYERALRMPIGEEWLARSTHQKVILPRVQVKQGVVVDPMTAPFK